MTETLKLTPSETLTVRAHETERLEVEATYGPGGNPPPPHLHPDQDEHFEVLEGRIATQVGGEERVLEVGETIEIPRGTGHQMWNPHDEPARVAWKTMPAGRTLEWFRSIDELYRTGPIADNGMPNPEALIALLGEYDDVFRLALD